MVAEKDSRFVGTREWSFRHDAVQRVAYGMIPEAARAPLHREAARWLEQQGEPDPLALASHFERAGETARAKDYYADAAARAAAAGDPRSAVRYYAESLGEGVAEIARVERVAALAAALISVGRYDETRSRVEELLREPAVLESRLRRAEALWLDGRALRALGRFDEAVARLEEARALLSGHPPSDLAFGVERALFWALWIKGDYAAVAAIEPTMRELAAAIGRPDQLSEAELAAASIHLLEGDLGQSVALAELAVAHAREVQHRFREADALLLLGSIDTIVGRFDAAREALSATEALAKRMRAPYFLPNIAAARGYVDLLEGRPTEAEARYADARAFAEASGDLRCQAMAWAGMARAIVRQNPSEADLARAAEGAARAVELGAGQGQAIEAEARLAAMEVAIARRDAAGAAAHARASIDLLDALGTQEQFEIEILLAAHDSLSLAGDEEDAAHLLRRASARLRARAERIADPAVRASFLEAVPHHRRLQG
ncbi:MAG: hypothetical protein M5U28_33365 [Sandaracinaceae bacterium]|nr:hypothetical protein [Sandaracinaceae bacterium]